MTNARARADKRARLARRWRQRAPERPRPVHHVANGVSTCCHRTVGDLPPFDRVTVHPERATCGRTP